MESVLSGLKKGGKESELVATKDKEISALKAEITASTEKFASDEAGYKQRLLGVVLEKDIASILPKYKAKSTATDFYIIDGVGKARSGRCRLKNEDGFKREKDWRLGCRGLKIL
ncbi:MAG: hypothetical protein H0A75_00220 [Candidatus Methanofishera endochildressiae]|uniref:Uncharacterized protein n=1 Tax=Candidatus Methanofishera endochildressiae TaxID=2738884 RepID=A0A7Z0MMD9_9GAMM|nr:hypothetical protein [Candidatus Methanofishera endochildressiae]